MTWKQTLDYLYSALPMYHRVGAAAYKASLDNTYAICKLLGNPEHDFKSVHVAGTNGKGSTSHSLAAILQEAGYKTGLFTSPHLHDFRERIRINGRMISRNYVSRFTEKNRKAFEKIKPSFFEMTAGLAFDYFRKKKVDIAVIETGLGGRLDSTNVITPVLSIITNIGWDHMNLLGNSLEKIAAEKAGIIKPGVPVIIGETGNSTKKIFMDKADSMKADIYFADQVFKTRVVESGNNRLILDIYKKGKALYPALELDLPGIYQEKNIKSIVLAAELLEKGGYRLNNGNIRRALKKVTSATGFKGRWQVLSKKPLTICDAAHNSDGFKEILKQLEGMRYGKLHWVLGVVNDKDIDPILSLLPPTAAYYFCQADIPRALDAEVLMEKAAQHGLNGIVIRKVSRALSAAKKQARMNDLVLVGGSIFVVGEICA